MKFILSLLLLCATTLCCAAAERMLITRLAPSQSSLFVSNADGSGEKALTEGSLDYNPVWSPDGQWIVFTSERNGSADLYRSHALFSREALGSRIGSRTHEPASHCATAAAFKIANHLFPAGARLESR
jgi:hypothetical protein